MKQRDLVKKLQSAGFKFERHGGNHDIYRRGKDEEQVPRHKEDMCIRDSPYMIRIGLICSLSFSMSFSVTCR